mmetsp:Transcript_14089/g.22414  ORF Transcript_14089/g.22414 Transcript_14089/m.22414 type:complete len:92 (-) Transcript_14089:21-296(-)
MPSLDSEEVQPTVRVFEDDTMRPRGISDSFIDIMPMSMNSTTTIRHELADLIIDGDVHERRSTSFQPGSNDTCAQVQVRNISCDIDERYFL